MTKSIMKFGTLAIAACFLVFSACTQPAQTEESEAAEVEQEAEEAEAEEPEKEAPASPRAKIESASDNVTVTIDWGSPAVKGRKIWGGLEPYGEVWRAGANETTNITFSADVTIGDTNVSAGTYGMFIIPMEEGDWTVILNTSYDREEHGIWGSMGYSDENDVVRVNVTPTWVDEVEERLKYDATDDAIEFAWEKVRLSVPYSVSE